MFKKEMHAVLLCFCSRYNFNNNLKNNTLNNN